MDGLDDLFRDPNGPAYQKRQTRTGPPLEYVAEKLSIALTELYRATHAGQGEGDPADERRELRSAFMHVLVAYLALGNMLALAEDPGALADRLLGSTREELDDWLWRVEREGSVTG